MNEQQKAIEFLQTEETGYLYSVVFKGQERQKCPTVLEALQRGILTKGEETEIRRASITNADFVELFSKDEIHQIIEAADTVGEGAAGEVCMDIIETHNQEVIIDRVYRVMQYQPDAASWHLAEGKLEIRKHDERTEKVKELVRDLFPDFTEVYITRSNGVRHGIYNRD